MANSDGFTRIEGASIVLTTCNGVSTTHALHCYGREMNFVYAKLKPGLYVFMLPGGEVNGYSDLKWSGLELPPEFPRGDTHVLSVRDIAAETARRLGVRR